MTEVEGNLAGVAAVDAPADRFGERLLSALLTVADERHITALVGASEPPLGVVVLPDFGSGVVIVDRGKDEPATLKQRLDAILRNHAAGILHLVLAGGTEADREVLTAADREAPDPNKLGVHLLEPSGRVRRVAGRRLGLLGDAAAALPRVEPRTRAELEAHNAGAQKRREEAAAFAAALDHRKQRAIRLFGVACIVFFALANIWGRRSYQLALLQMGGNIEELVRGGEVFRLLSYAFLHADSTHLIVNLIGLFSFGGFLEALLGWRRIVVLYVASALLGGIASAFIGNTTLSVGASGAIWGLMAAGVAIVVRREAILPPLIGARMRPRLLAVLGLNLFFSIMPRFVPGFPNIDLWAHVGGGVAGFLLVGSGLLTKDLGAGVAPSAAEANPRWLRIAALVAVALTVASVAWALGKGHPWQPQVVWEPDQVT
jgi:rhomboid protease GluP